MMLQNPVRRVATVILSAGSAGFLVPGLVLGHAQLDTPTPADKSTVTTAVTEVAGTFTQRIKSDGSTLVVKLVGGGTVAEGGADPADDHRMVATPASPLGSGSYQVEWTTNSAEDNEVARGTWTFTVAVAAPSPTPAVTAAASAVPTASVSVSPSATASLPPAPAPSADGSSTGSGSDVLLPIVVALIVLGAGAAYLLSRRNRPPDPL